MTYEVWIKTCFPLLLIIKDSQAHKILHQYRNPQDGYRYNGTVKSQNQLIESSLFLSMMNTKINILFSIADSLSFHFQTVLEVIRDEDCPSMIVPSRPCKWIWITAHSHVAHYLFPKPLKRPNIFCSNVFQFFNGASPISLREMEL